VDAQRWAQLSARLDSLLDLEPDARVAALRELERDDAALAAELRRLLALEAAHGDFLSEPLPIARVEAELELPPQAGDAIGPYHLIRLLGEGGMGSVWLAGRADGLYQREVALKLLRADASAPGLRARFARERQILAQLSHPNIARLFDAGVDAAGRPYLALEYVEGETLIDYARRRALDVPRRIELVLQVCEAVAYAHGRLVVHRDLKPSNILVREDGRVQLLDFGIAKLLDPEATGGATELTRFGGRAYTPHYAAPEQIRGEAISTQTDVYALGVVLFELLTGQRPYRLKRHTTAELEEAVLQLEPQRASQALRRGEEDGTDPGGGTRTARQRARTLSGDIDNILLMALRKAPEQRYASIEAFAKDLRRHLDGHPVSARPDRFGYRTGKFVRRNAVALGLGSGALLLLLCAAGLLWWQAREALAAAQRAQAMQDFMLGLFERTDPSQAQRGDLSVAELLRDGATRARGELQVQPAVQTELLLTIASLQSGFGRYADALALLDTLPPREEALLRLRHASERARALRGLERIEACLDALAAAAPDADALAPREPLAVAQYHALRGRCLRRHGDTDAARGAFETALALRESNAAPELQLTEVLTDLAALDADAGAYDRAIERMQQALARLERGPGSDNLMGVNLWRSLGALQRDKGDPAAAEAAFRRALQLGDTLFPGGHPATAEARRQLAATYVDYGRLDEAEPLLAQVLEFQRRTLGAQHPDVGSTLNSQAILAWKRGDDTGAERLLDEAIALWRGSEQRGRLASGLHNLGMVLADAGDAARAEPLLREALQLREQVFGPDHVPVAMSLRLLGEAALEAGRLDEAGTMLERALRIERAHHGDPHPQTALVQLALAQLDYARDDRAAGDARIDQVLKHMPDSDAERDRVRRIAQLLQAQSRCRAGHARAGRAQLAAAEPAPEARHGVRVALRRAQQACDAATPPR
jgi:serine/threonine protein kinase/Tfp pilus assembly protein PilF